jgi:para-nitrobenzyl esterase
MTRAVVRLESGSLAGAWNADRTVCAFKGVPYARPPIGPLRWQPPLPPERWSGTRPADGSDALRAANRPAHAVEYFGAEPESELSLSERLAAAPTAGGNRRCSGCTAAPSWSGRVAADLRRQRTRAARRGGGDDQLSARPAGILAHPELSAERPYRASGSYGLLDRSRRCAGSKPISRRSAAIRTG